MIHNYIYFSFRPDSPDNQEKAVKCVHDCITDVHACMACRSYVSMTSKLNF